MYEALADQLEAAAAALRELSKRCRELETQLKSGVQLSDLRLSVRARHALMSAEIKSIGQLTGMSARDLGRLKNCGDITVGEIEAELAKRGLALRPEDEE